MPNHRRSPSVIATLWLSFALLFAVSAATARAQNYAALEAAYAEAVKENVSVLAPRAWKTAAKSYSKAQQLSAEAPGNDKTLEQISTATEDLDQAVASARQVRAQIEPLLGQRKRAQDANAESLAATDWNRAEKEFSRVTAGLEKGATDKLLQKATDVAAMYSAAELAALTNDLLIRARGAEALALVGDADKLAPETFQQGEKSLQAAIEAMRADRYDRGTATGLADAAEAHFKHATQITLSAQQVKSGDLSIEQLILLWENRLNKINVAAGREYDPLTGWDATADELAEAVTTTNARIISQQQKLDEARSYITSLEEELRLADAALGGTLEERDRLILLQEKQARDRERLKQIEALFEPEEATVLRESDNIILRLTGLRFASGSSKLSNSSRALLAKVEAAIGAYPGSAVMVEGHTDAKGSVKLNARLSEDRANTVMRYMITEMKIQASRLGSAGFGSNRPVALNTTEEGRAKNRRIDIIITPVKEPVN